ncbi:MAG: hypothetical protein WBP52_11780 [Terriglobales bacterium]
MDRSGRAAENNFGVEEGAGDAGGDGEQFPLAAEYVDLGGAGEVEEIHGAAAADASGGRMGQRLTC